MAARAKRVAILGLKVPVKIVDLVVNGVLALLGAVRLNSPNRIVVALSPLFFTLSGALLALAARYLPLVGHRLSAPELTGLFIGGALLGSSKVLMWLHGWQAHEKQQHQELVPVKPPDPISGVGDIARPAPIVVNVHPTPAPPAESVGWTAKTVVTDPEPKVDEGSDLAPPREGAAPVEIHEVGT